MTTLSPLQRAIRCLSINDVYIRSTHCSTAKNFEVKLLTDVSGIGMEIRNVLVEHTLVEVDGFELFKVVYDLGVRMVRNPNVDDTDESRAEVLSTIEAFFVAEYVVTDEGFDADSQQVFAEENAIYHIWPYWREFISSQSDRMRLPKLVLPMKIPSPTESRPVID